MVWRRIVTCMFSRRADRPLPPSPNPPCLSPQVVNDSYFELVMLVLITISSLELCFDDSTVEKGSIKFKVLYALDMTFTIAFGIEVRATLGVTVGAASE